MDKVIAFQGESGVEIATPPYYRKKVLVEVTKFRLVELTPAVIEEQEGVMVEVTPAVVEPRPLAAKYRDETDDEMLARVAKLRAPGKDTVIMSVGSIPHDQTFRLAWVLTNDAVVVDMVKARETHRAHIRRARTSRFDALDAEYRQAEKDKDVAEMQAIKVHRQELRDLPEHPSIEAAQTPAQLKAAWPSLLSPNPYTEKSA